MNQPLAVKSREEFKTLLLAILRGLEIADEMDRQAAFAQIDQQFAAHGGSD